MKQTYKIVVFEPNSWIPGYGQPVRSECPHQHRTISGANRCYQRLTRRLKDGTWLAKWNNAVIIETESRRTIEPDVNCHSCNVLGVLFTFPPLCLDCQATFELDEVGA